MGDFHASYPEYAATARLDALRASEYSYLDEGGHVYLDYTGAGLTAQSQLPSAVTATAGPAWRVYRPATAAERGPLRFVPVFCCQGSRKQGQTHGEGPGCRFAGRPFDYGERPAAAPACDAGRCDDSEVHDPALRS